MSDHIKRTVRVTIEKEIDIYMPAHYGSAEYIADFKSLYASRGTIERIFEFAAENIAAGNDSGEIEGLGAVGWMNDGNRKIDVGFDINYDEMEVEFI